MAVLGSLLFDWRQIDDLTLQSADFHSDANARLYGHLQAMQRAGGKFDAVLLADRLKTAGDLDACGGVAYLAEVAGSVPYSANLGYYARIVRAKAQCRSIIHAATEALRDAWADKAVPEDVLDQAERALTAIRTNDSTAALVDAVEAAARATARIDGIYARDRQAGILTGLEPFDRTFGGVFAGELVVVAARLGIGKTALACQWADWMASHGKLTYFASLEMDAAELATRILCTLGRVSGAKIRNATLDESDIVKLSAASVEFSRRTIRFDERARLRVSDVRRETRRLVKHGLQVVFVDYLQRIQPENRRDPREQQVAQIARDLKELARELKVPVVVLAQLNRDKGATEGTGGAENLRESDAIGQEADMVVRIDVKDKDELKMEYWLRMVKNRNGPRGKFRVTFDTDLTLFGAFDTPVEAMANYDHDLGEHDGSGNREW
jgi:replicative DNA helicase